MNIIRYLLCIPVCKSSSTDLAESEHVEVLFTGTRSLIERRTVTHCCIHNKVIIVKTINFVKNSIKDEYLTIIKEIKRVQPKYVVQILHFENNDNNGIITVYMKYHGKLDLFEAQEQRIQLRRPIPYSIYEKYVIEIAKAIQALHKLNIIHGDIKLENVVIDHVDSIYLVDFDGACFCHNTHQYNANDFPNTIGYVSPERILYGIMCKENDIWSFGILIYALFEGCLPFNQAYITSICQSNQLLLNFHFTPEYLQPIVINALKIDFNLRNSMTTIIDQLSHKQ